jgi:ribose transport system permease protein
MLLLVLLLNALVTPNFLDGGTLRNFVLQIYPTLLIALGATLVIATAGIDISVGAVMALSASVAVRLQGAGLGLAGSLLGGIAAAGACGAFNGLLVAKLRIQPIIVTLILMIGGRGLAQIILGELALSTYGTSISTLGSFTLFGVLPVQLLIMVLCVGLALFAVEKTVLGRHLEALGDNPSAARLVGIRIPAYIALTYVVSAVLSGVAGIMEGARMNAINAGTLGLLIELDAIAAVAIGGTAFSGGKPRIVGTLVGASIVQLITMMVNMNDISFHWSLIVKAAIVVGALYLQRERLS